MQKECYVGWRDDQGVRVAGFRRIGPDTVPVALAPRNDLRNHSPDGFEWGYGGSGPAQLALALLADVVGNDRVAEQLYQRFKWEVISKLPKEKWTLSREDILDWVLDNRAKLEAIEAAEQQ